MPPILTLHHGEGQASFTEHPTEVARKALLAASQVEEGRFADNLFVFARPMPDRTAVAEEGAA